MAKQLILTNGDYGTLIRTNIIDDLKAIMPLTLCTVVGDLVKSDGTKKVINFTISDAINGVAQYQLTTLDTDVSGVVTIYVSVLSGSFKITSNNTIIYVVIDKDGGVI